MKFFNYIVFILFLGIMAAPGHEVLAAEIFGTPAQQIEVAQQELLLLQTLIKNYNLNQTINADAYIAVDLSDNTVILQKNADKSYPIASVTKLMNAVISLQNTDMNEKITLTGDMLSPLGDSPCLYSGLKITAQNLFKAALIQSSNDAAEALSCFMGNEKFIELMNRQAQDLKMKNTVYRDVYGINSSNRSGRRSCQTGRLHK